MIIEKLELTHFGGLAKVLIAKQTEGGVLKNLATRYPLTMKYSIAKLKNYVSEKRLNRETGEYFIIVEKELVNEIYNEYTGLTHEQILWRNSIWDLAIYRSLEIWKKLNKIEIERSLGVSNLIGKKSISGKLGSGNKKYFIKDEKNQWHYIKFRETKYDKYFKQFEESAIEICKKRARTK